MGEGAAGREGGEGGKEGGGAEGGGGREEGNFYVCVSLWMDLICKENNVLSESISCYIMSSMEFHITKSKIHIIKNKFCKGKGGGTRRGKGVKLVWGADICRRAIDVKCKQQVNISFLRLLSGMGPGIAVGVAA